MMERYGEILGPSVLGRPSEVLLCGGHTSDDFQHCGRQLQLRSYKMVGTWSTLQAEDAEYENIFHIFIVKQEASKLRR